MPNWINWTKLNLILLNWIWLVLWVRKIMLFSLSPVMPKQPNRSSIQWIDPFMRVVGTNHPRPFFKLQSRKDSHFSVSSDKSKEVNDLLMKLPYFREAKQMLVFKECNLNHDFLKGDINLSVEYRNPLKPRHCLINVKRKTWNDLKEQNFGMQRTA